MNTTDVRELPQPYDPRCETAGRDMDEYDFMIEGSITPESREAIIRLEEGTYNPENGHFLCTACYIAVGMPSSKSGWKCP